MRPVYKKNFKMKNSHGRFGIPLKRKTRVNVAKPKHSKFNLSVSLTDPARKRIKAITRSIAEIIRFATFLLAKQFF